ncbi:MAG: hypothetical protein MI922_25445 [Bacteroidales bacterium]|nr:hypothetical protein [Bacteroidales bacterium]
MNTHIIHKQILNIAHPNTMDSLELPMQIQNICKQQLECALDNACKNLSLEETYVQIDSICLHLNNIRPNFFQEDFSKQLETELISQVTNLLANTTKDNTSLTKNKTASLKPGRKEVVTDNILNNVTGKQVYSAPASLELLEHYFNTGSLPVWNVKAKQDLKMLVKNCLDNHKGGFMEMVIRIVNNKSALKRFIYTLDYFILDEVFLCFEPATTKHIIKAKTEIIEKIQQRSPGLPQYYIKERFYLPIMDLIPQIVKNNNHEFQPGIINSAISKLTKLEMETFGNTKPGLKESIELNSETPVAINKNQNEIINEHPSSTDKNTYWVSNAGIVLLWPFLEGFFMEEKLIVEQNFKDEHCHFKAIQFLQYLSTGSDDYEDFETHLSKMLCGIAPENPVPELPPLDNEERIRADNLVGAMIKNWPVVKDTSVESIRETFFIRCGEIVRKDNGWLLQIEKKTYDVLLGKLPWNIGIIYLPWCKELLHVNWE